MNLTKNGITIEVQDAQVVELVLKQLNGSAPRISEITAFPAIGTYWHGQGGIFAGIMRGRDGGLDCALILGPMLPEGNFQAIQDRAAAIEVDGHKDFRCPYRTEQSLLFANLKDQFKPTWHWSCERHQGLEDYAWMQYFKHGYQTDCHIDRAGLGCAVRVIPLQ